HAYPIRHNIAMLPCFCCHGHGPTSLSLPLHIDHISVCPLKHPCASADNNFIRSRRKTPAFMREDTSRAARRQSPFPMLLLLTFYAHSGLFVPVLLPTSNSILFGRFAVNRSRE